MSDNDQIRFENGCFVIPKKELDAFLRVTATYMKALSSFPQEDAVNAIKEATEKYNVSEEDMNKFLVVVLDLLKTELTN